MVDFTIRDVQILLATFLTLIILNAFASAAGLADAGLEEDDVPELNMTTDRFDFAGNPPDRPLSESEFIIGPGPKTSEHPVNYDLNSSATLIHFGGDASDNWTVKLRVNGVIEDEVDIQGNGTVEVIDSNGWRIHLEMLNQQTGEILGDVTESPGGSGGILSFLGDTADAIFGVVKQLQYFARVLWYFVLTFVDSVLNAFVALFDVAVFLVSLLGFLFSSMTTLVSSPTQTWASLILASPIVVISLMFAKLGLAIVSASDWI